MEPCNVDALVEAGCGAASLGLPDAKMAVTSGQSHKMMNRFCMDWFNNLTQNVGIQTKNSVHVCRIEFCKSPEVFSKSSSNFVFHKLSAFCREVAFVSEGWYIIDQKIGLKKLSLKFSSFGVDVSKS